MKVGPRGNLGADGNEPWPFNSHAKAAAAQFLVSHFPLETSSAHTRNQVIHQLAELCNRDKSDGSDTAMRGLLDIAEKGGPEARKAAQYLIGRQLMRRSEVEKITEMWRATPPDGLSPSVVAEFIALHPRFAGRQEELTSSDEGPALQIHLTTEGKLGGLGLK